MTGHRSSQRLSSLAISEMVALWNFIAKIENFGYDPNTERQWMKVRGKLEIKDGFCLV